jgi:hypothetical protein
MYPYILFYNISNFVCNFSSPSDIYIGPAQEGQAERIKGLKRSQIIGNHKEDLMSTKMENKPNSTFLYPGIRASLHAWILQNKANLISQFSILNSQFRSLRLRNKPIYPVYPVNPVKKIILRNEPISESRRSFQLRATQSPPPADSSLFPFSLYPLPFSFFTKRTQFPSRLCRITSPHAFPRHKSGLCPANSQKAGCRKPGAPLQ